MFKKKKKQPPIDATEFYADTEAGLTGDGADQLYAEFHSMAEGAPLPGSGELDGTHIAAAFDHDAATDDVAGFYDAKSEADRFYEQAERGELGDRPGRDDDEGFTDATGLHGAHERRAKMTSKERLALEKKHGKEAYPEPEKPKEESVLKKGTVLIVLALVVFVVAVWRFQ